MTINSNLDINQLLSFKEVGYLKELLKLIEESEKLNVFNIFIYFKRTNENWNLESEFINNRTILFVVIDETGFVPDSISSKPLIVFKTYLINQESSKNVFHLPVGDPLLIQNPPIKPINDRRIRVFFSGNLHIGRENFYKYFIRIYWLPFSVLHRLRKLFKEDFSTQFNHSYIKFTRNFATGLSPLNYTTYLHDSQIVLCPPGNPGQETLRHFEAMRAGCIIISEKLPNTNCFADSPIIMIDNWKELDGIINELTSKPLRLSQEQNKMRSWWNDKCSEKATLNYIIEKVNAIMKDDPY